MGTQFLQVLLDIVKLSPKYWAPPGLVALTVLLLPDTALEWFGAVQLEKEHRWIFGLLSISSGSVLAVALATWSGRNMLARWQFRVARNQIIDRLERLTEGEKEILRYYIVRQTRSNSLQMDGVVCGLEIREIIFKPHGEGSISNGFWYVIHDFAWDHLNKHPELLVGTSDSVRCDHEDFDPYAQRQ